MAETPAKRDGFLEALVSRRRRGLAAAIAMLALVLAPAGADGAHTRARGEALNAAAKRGAPTITGEGSQNLTPTGATVTASITPNGSPTSYYVNYGLTTKYDQRTSPVAIGNSNINGIAAVPVMVALTGLLPNTTYHFQFYAKNDFGPTLGPDATFTTPPPSPPAVTGETAENVAATAASLFVSIDSRNVATTYVIEYGTTTAYGQTTAPVSVPAAPAAQETSQAISGLLANTTYHFRFDATNAGGTTNGDDTAFTTTGGATTTTSTTTTTTTTTTPPKSLPPPVKGHSANVFLVGGTVLVNGHTLTAGEQIPFGSIVDTLHGIVLLETISPSGKLQSAKFYEGIFQLTSPADGSTELDLKGGNFGVCTTKGTRLPAAAGLTHSTTTVRSLWGNGHGVFTTKGRYAAATVRGTIWETVDRCDGTLIKSAKDTVSVTDLQTGKTYVVLVGHAIVILAP